MVFVSSGRAGSKLTFMGNRDSAYSENLEDDEFEEMIVDSTLAQKLKEAILGQALSKSKKALADRIASSEPAVPVRLHTILDVIIVVPTSE
jgi:hypothetical protein